MGLSVWKRLFDRRNVYIAALFFLTVTLYKSSPLWSALTTSNGLLTTQIDSPVNYKNLLGTGSTLESPASEFEARRSQEIYSQLLASHQMTEKMKTKLSQKFCPFGSVPKRFLKLYFNHPPKTAGTSIACALTKDAGCKRRETCLGIAEFDNMQVEFNCVDDVLVCHSHRWYPGVRRRISNETITVTATRDPVSRILGHVKQLYDIKGKVCNATRIVDAVEGYFGLDHLHWYHLGVRPTSLSEAERLSEEVALQYDFVFVTEDLKLYKECWERLHPEFPMDLEHLNIRGAEDGECEETVSAAKKVQSFEGILHRALVRRGRAICNFVAPIEAENF